MLSREFTSITITSRNLVEVVALEAITKLRHCDMCQLENFICEYKRYSYQLLAGTQEVMKNTFFAKLPHGWDKASNEAFKLLLEKNQIIDSLGGRIEVVRQLIRTRCLDAKLDKDTKKLHFNDVCCYNFYGVLGQYGCEKSSSKTPKHHNWKTHKKWNTFLWKRKFPKRFKSMRKRPISNKTKLSNHRRFIRKVTAKEQESRKYYATCPSGKNAKDCNYCWICGSKDHNADRCPNNSKKKASLKFLIGCLNSLRFLNIYNCSKLECLCEDIGRLRVIRRLWINKCPSLISLPRGVRSLSSLEDLCLIDCERLNLDLSIGSDEQHNHEELNSTGPPLRLLQIRKLPQLVELPQWLLLCSTNTLQFLYIGSCSKLKVLPESMQKLQVIDVRSCPELSSLPMDINHLIVLRELKIKDCPKLTERCRPEVGEDGTKIAHIPKIELDREIIKSTEN